MDEIIFIVEPSNEGGYTAKALGYSIFTEGETIEEVKENIRDAVRCHFEVNALPKIIHLHIVKNETMTV